MKKANTKIMISRKDLRQKVQELGKAITKDYEGKSLVVIGVLKGSFVFLADLIREIDLPLEIEFLGASSYGKAQSSSGVVKITLDLSVPIEGKHVLLVEDIVDTGLTLDFLIENIRLRHAKSLKICSLLLKPSKIEKDVPIDYVGFEIEDKFVIGYGLDDAGFYRNLPDLVYIEEEET